MSAQKVDVLGVLDEAQDWLYRSSESRGDDERAEKVQCVRAAVAELIEAGKSLIEWNRDVNGTGEQLSEKLSQLEIAIARIGGAA